MSSEQPPTSPGKPPAAEPAPPLETLTGALPEAPEAATISQNTGSSGTALSAQAALSAESFPVRFGRYEIRQLLGKGGMGAVYLAHDSQLDRLVALKIPSFTAGDRQLEERFLQEARTAATLHHANICPVHDVGVIDGLHYLTMAYIEGKPLADMLPQSQKPLGVRQAVSLVRKLALALSEAHRQQVIHRDLKPANIIIDKRGEPVIMDFGLGRRGSQQGARLTQAGAIMGTPAYMAPEQARGDVERMGPASDIYSLGVILYELLTGRPPFEGDAMAILSQVLVDEPTPPAKYRPEIDARLDAICLKAMAKKPDARFRSMAELAGALTDYLKTVNPSAVAAPGPAQAAGMPFAHEVGKTEFEPEPPPAGGRDRRRGVPWGSVVAIGAILAAMGGGILYMVFHQGGRRADLPDSQARSPGATTSTAIAAARPSATAPDLGKPPPPAAAEAAKPLFKWPAELLRDGKIPAPDLSKLTRRVHHDYAVAKLPAQESHGYDKGVYFVKRGEWVQSGLRDDWLNYACQVVGRAVGGGVWHLHLTQKDRKQSVVIDLNRDGGVRITATAKDDPPVVLLPWANHPAIKKGDDYNTVLAILRGGVLEVYVNQCAVCDPVRVDCEITPSVVQLSYLGPGPGHRAEFKEFTLWSPVDSLPSPQARLGAILETVPFAWPAEALKEGKITAPDLSKSKPWYQDKFADPKSGWPKGKSDQVERGYKNGRYEVVHTGPAMSQMPLPVDQGKPAKLMGDFACQITGKVTAQGVPASWGLFFTDTPNPSAAVRFRVMLGADGRLHFGRMPGEIAIMENPPELTLRHTAIHGSGSANTLLVVVRSRQLEIYVNGVAVCDPILLTRELTTGYLALACGGLAKGAHYDFDSVTLWPARDLPSLEKRGAMPKGKQGP